MKRSPISLLSLLALAIFCFYHPANAQVGNYKTPKNIIIFIGDGMGYNGLTAANYFLHDGDKSQAFENFPVQYAVSTYPARTNADSAVNHWNVGYNPFLAWTDFDYLKQSATGSAEASTAMATGKKTYEKAIGMDVNGNALLNITQHSKNLGKSAGVVTSVQFAHATPAGFVAHNLSRHNYSQIAREMILDSRLDVIMGCGHPYFDGDGNPSQTALSFDKVGGQEVWQNLKAGSTGYGLASIASSLSVQDCDGDGVPDPWALVETREAFRSLMTGVTPKRVLGVPQVKSTLQYSRSGSTDSTAFSVPFIKTVPTLKEMTLAAINVLDDNPEGFFLMVEGGAIDWANHDSHTGRMIEEQNDFNLAVDAVVQWVENHGGWNENLLIVTSDHECGYITGPIPNDASPHTNPIINHGKGAMPGMRYNSGSHTNMLVPFFAKGAGSELFHLFADEVDYVMGPYLQNTEIAQVMFLLWRKK